MESVKNSISETVKQKHCMSCGACFSVCPSGAITMAYEAEEGFYRPSVREDLCVNCGTCRKVCPALRQEETPLLGQYSELLLAHAMDARVRHESTSGGMINALVRYLLESETTEAVLLCAHDCESPIETAAVLLTKENVKELSEHPREFASRYVTVPLAMEAAKLAGVQKAAVVGTACQIRAVSLMKELPQFAEWDLILIGMTCSGGMSFRLTEEYRRKKRMPEGKMYYRGLGWPGKNTLVSEGKKAEYDHMDSLFERMFSSHIFRNPGCELCRDHFAEKADISFCDFWNGQEMKTEKEGNSVVILRSARACEIFNRMEALGYAENVRSLTKEEVVRTQKIPLKEKKGNLRSNPKYRKFRDLLTCVFEHRLYRPFSKPMYHLFCRRIAALCRGADLPEE